MLRDGRHLVGVMRSYDQFSNIVLEDTHERHFVGGECLTLCFHNSVASYKKPILFVVGGCIARVIASKADLS